MTDTFYATIPVTPADRPKAGSQAAAILALFEQTRRAMSPSEVLEALRRRAGNGEAGRWLRTPLTSVRARMTTLERTRPAWLRKTDDIIPGPMGRPQHRWRLAERPAAVQGRLF